MASRRSKKRKRRRAKRLRQAQFAIRGRSAGPTGVPTRVASISGARAAGVRLFLSSQIGKKIANVARQQVSRIPGVGNLFRTTRRARERSRSLVGPSGAALVRPARTRGVARRVVARAAPIVAAGGAFQAGAEIIDFVGGANLPSLRGRRGQRLPSRGQGIPFTPGTVVPTDSITHTWVANGVPFAQLADGRVMVRKKNGQIKTFRRPKPIVLGRNPTIRQLARADKKIDQAVKLMRKRMPSARKQAAKRTAPVDNVQIVRAG